MFLFINMNKSGWFLIFALCFALHNATVLLVVNFYWFLTIKLYLSSHGSFTPSKCESESNVINIWIHMDTVVFQSSINTKECQRSKKKLLSLFAFAWCERCISVHFKFNLHPCLPILILKRKNNVLLMSRIVQQ